MSSDTIIKGNQNTTKLINQLKRSTIQYPCLSKKKEEELIAKYKDDLPELKRLLYMHNIKIVFNIAKKYMSKVNDFDDLVQDGLMGLAEAVNRFDLNRGVKFITFCVPWIRKYILMHFNGNEYEVGKHSISINTPINNGKKGNSSEPTTFENYVNDYVDKSVMTIPSTQSALSSNEQINLCKMLYSKLNEDTSLSSTEKSVFIDAFYNRDKTRIIAERYNIDMRTVSDIKHKILGKFRNILEKEKNIKTFYDIRAEENN